MRRSTLLAVVGCLLLLASPAALSAQIRTIADSVLADSLRADSLRRADSLKTVQQTSDAFTNSARLAKAQFQPLPSVGVGGVHTPLTHWEFTRDSIDWVAAQTVGELLQLKVPGLVLLRAGTYGRPELPQFQGRGATSVIYYFDGVRRIPLGQDSVSIDPSFFSLSLLDRIDVDAAAGITVVHIFSRLSSSRLPRTRIGFAAGDQGYGRYLATLEQRAASGFGLTLGAEYFGVNGPTGGSGGSAVTNGLAQFSYFPNPHYGAQLQYLAQAPGRDALLGGSDTLYPQVKGTRSDLQLCGFWRRDTAETGLRVDAFLSRSSWRDDQLKQSLAQIGAVAEYRQPTYSSLISVWHQTEWTPLDARIEAGWTPNQRISGAFEWVAQKHSNSRGTSYLSGNLSLTLPFGIVATGVVRDGHRVQAPSLTTDLAQRFTDMQITGSYQKLKYGIEAGYVRNDGWRPLGFQELYRFPNLAPLPTTEWATLHARVTPKNWLTLESVYTEPLLGALPGGSPPHHAVTTATLRSRFLHKYPRNVFDMKIQGIMESWSPGIAGYDLNNNPVSQPGRTFYRAIIELQIGPFIAYYDKANLRGKGTSYLPGYEIPGLSSTFGVRWAFLN